MANPVKRLGQAPRLDIDVTQEIIATAEPRNSGHCMIADAVREAATKAGLEASRIAVDLQTIRFTDRKKGRRYIYLTPRRGQVSLIEFDQGQQQTEPFRLQLRGGQVVSLAKATHEIGSRSKAKLEVNDSNQIKRTGGKAPPRGGAGQRREFGIRGYRS